MREVLQFIRTLLVSMFVAGALLGLYATGGQAQEKPLIEKWLDGEVKANYPKITYSGPPIELRWASFTGEISVDTRAFKRLEGDTNGKLVVRTYWGNTLANMTRGAFESVSAGIADFGPCLVSFNPGGFTLHAGLQMPFAFENAVQGAWVATELYPQFLKRDYEAKGVYLLRLSFTRPSQLMTAKTSIEKLEDLRGKKIWSLGSPLVNDMIKSLGATPTFVPLPETYTALQSGVVDGVANHDAAFLFFKWSEVGKYHTKANLWPQTFEYCVNKEKFDGLPRDLRAIFYHWAQLTTQANAELYYEATSRAAIADMQKRGIKMNTLSNEELARWSAAIQPAFDRFIAQNKDRGSAEFVAGIKALTEKYGKMSPDEITKGLLEKPLPGVITMKD